MESELSTTAIWAISVDLVVALDARLGPPVDCYVNGSQTWLTADGPNDYMLEWRLHPVGGYITPAGISHYEVFETTIAAISVGADTTALVLGDETRSLNELWSGLECFAAYGDPMTPAELRDHATKALDREPDRCGVVEHQRIGDAWEQSQRRTSLYTLVDAALDASSR